MENYQLFIKKLFDEYKCKDKMYVLHSLPIYNDNEELVAFLRPITADYRVSMPTCSTLLSDWRAQNPSLSDSVFTITVERTEKWLDDLVIGRDDRLLFMIVLLDGTFVGHMGYSSFKFEDFSAEIDSILRGVKDKAKGLMTHALHTLLWWGKNIARIQRIELSTGLDNLQSQALYQRCGFVDKEKKALVRVVKGDEVRWDPAEDPNMENAERYSLVMVLEDKAYGKY